MAQYYVIHSSGEKFGPAEIPLLNTWAIEGRVSSASMVEDAETGVRMPITSLPGFVAPPTGQNFANYSRNPYEQPPGSYRQVPNNLTLAIVSTVCCCQLFGIIAIVFAAQVEGHCRRGDYARAEDSAKKAKLFAILGIVLGAIGTIGYIAITVLSDSKAFR